MKTKLLKLLSALVVLLIISCDVESDRLENLSNKIESEENPEDLFRNDIEPASINFAELEKLAENSETRIPLVNTGSSLNFNFTGCPPDDSIAIRTYQNFINPPCDYWYRVYFGVKSFYNFGLINTHQSYIDISYFDVATGNLVQQTGDINQIVANTLLNPFCTCPALFWVSFPPNEVPNTIYIRLRKIDNVTGCESVSQVRMYYPAPCS